MIEFRHVNKKYGSKFVLQDANFVIERGRIVGFLGQNGAGKSTTLNIMTGYLAATSGEVLFDGKEISKSSWEIRDRIGYMPEIPPLYDDMTVGEYLRFVCELRRVNKRQIAAHLERIYALVSLGDMRRRLIRNLSKGYRQRVGMAAALAGDPEIIIMDEPTAGLDPKQIVEIRSLIRRLGETHTVILSSHILHEVSDVCEDIIIIHQGRIIRQSPLNELIASENEQSAVSVRFRGDEAAVCGAIRDMEAVRQVQKAACPEPDAVEIRVVAQAGADIRAPLWECLKRTDASVLMMKREEAGLEEVFLKLIGAGKEV